MVLIKYLSLNITAATRVHILEPQWNPFVEKQAIGRAVRFGQKRAVSVVRYIVPRSIETVSLSSHALSLWIKTKFAEKRN